MGLHKGQHHEGQFKSGNKGGGRPALSDEERKIRNEFDPLMMKIMDRYLSMTHDEFINYEPENMRESLIKRILKKAHDEETIDPVKYIFDRIAGKPRETVNFDSPLQLSVDLLAGIPTEEIIKIGRKIVGIE